MATSGLLINDSNIYGLVNPPPDPTAYNPKAWQTVGSGAVRWDEFQTLKGRVDTLVNDAPGTLDTLNELAAALNDDASFSATVTNSIATKAALAGADFTGDVSVATAKNLTITGHNGTNKGLVLGTTLVTATGAELNFMDGVTSAVQTQIDAKMALAGGTFTGTVILSGAPTADLHAATKKYVDDNAGGSITGAATTIDTEDLTVSRALISNASGKVAVSAVTDTELGYLDGVSSAIQTQLNAKQGLNAKLTDLAGLAVTANNFIAGDGSNFVLKTAAEARTAMGVDAAGTDNSTNVSLAAVTGNYLTLSGQAITAGTVPVVLGGTGATTAAAARTGLGVAIGSDVQAYSANLDAIAALSKTADNFIVANGTTWTLKTPADTRSSLGLGALATAGTISNANWSGDDLALANGGTGASTAAAARTNLGLVIGTNVEAHHDSLSSIAGLTTAANKMIYTTAENTYAVADLTAAGRALLDDADAATQCTTLGLGTGSDVTFNQVTAALVGNASTATKLAASKTIGGVAFDGSANIDLPGVNTAGTQNTSGTAANLSGSQTQKYVYAAPNANDGTASFRALVASDIPTLNQATTANAGTATALATARTIGGVSFDGSANINLPGVNAAGNQDTTGNAATASAAAGGSALETALAAKAALAGATYTGFVTLHSEPTAALHAASKSYVDSVAAGLDPKESVRVATDAAGTLASSFANGETVDGITLATGDRILIKTQADGSENGIYTVNASGAPTRATDFDSTTEVTAGAFTFVEEGTSNASAGFVLATTGSITVGTTAMTFTQFSSAAALSAGTGLSKSGNTLSVDAAQTQITSVGTLSGLTSTGNVVLTGATTTVAAPSADTHASTKKYVDDTVAAISLTEFTTVKSGDGTNAGVVQSKGTGNLTLRQGDAGGTITLSSATSSNLGYPADALTIQKSDYAEGGDHSSGDTSLLVGDDNVDSSAYVFANGSANYYVALKVSSSQAGKTLTGLEMNLYTNFGGGTQEPFNIRFGYATAAKISAGSSAGANAPVALGLTAASTTSGSIATTNTGNDFTGTIGSAHTNSGNGDYHLEGFNTPDNATRYTVTLTFDGAVTMAVDDYILLEICKSTASGNVTGVTHWTAYWMKLIGAGAGDAEVSVPLSAASTLSVTGALTAASTAAITGNTTVGGTLGVTGAITATAGVTGDVTGNCSGTAATVTGAAQTNITSVGTLTGLTVDGDVTISDGTNDFNIASHDGTNGLQLGGTQITATAAQLNFVTGVTSAIQTQLDAKGTGTVSALSDLSITATTAELNILDGSATTQATVTLADGDGVVISDGDVMKQCLVSDFKTYVADLTLTTAAQTAITSVGTLTSLKIADGATIGSASDADAITIAANGTCTFSAGISGTLTGNVTGNVTGNCSGTAATVTGAAQTNITSVGTLTALTVDDIAIDGKVITMTGSTDDTAVLTVAENGALTITTTDTAAAAANITITADGTAELGGTTVTLNSSGGITLDADNGTITFSDAGVSLGTITSSGYSGNAATASSISGLTASVAELNILDGVTALAAELNILDGVTATTAELNILDGSETTQATVTLVDGDGVVISDGDVMKQCLVSDFKTYVADLTLTTAAQAAITSVGTLTGLTVNGNVTVSDGSNDFDIASHDGTNGLKLGGTLITASAAELNYVDGVTSSIQTQLGTKADLASPTLTGTPLAPTAAANINTTQIATTEYVTTAITNTDIANATDAATANKIVKRDSNGNAAFVNVTASVITTGTSGGVGADVSSLTTRVTALEDSVKSSGSAPTTATVGVVGDILFTTSYLYILVSTSGSGESTTYNWKKVALADL